MSVSPTHLLHRAKQRADEIFASKVQGLGLTPRQFVILHTIHANPGLNQFELSALTGSDRSTISELANRMSKRGLIDRVRSKVDNRQWILNLTSQGRDYVLAGLPAIIACDKRLLEEISPVSPDLLLEALRQIMELAELSNNRTRDSAGGPSHAMSFALCQRLMFSGELIAVATIFCARIPGTISR